ncbi:DUF87 domain-containing protein [Actinomadura fulvescens]|uniref:Helicase HerA central domain-containing protein n=1 Tax=Actinomadura fulvescens TaxID=46160 RepID=A0ABN3PJX7_9ACTN
MTLFERDHVVGTFRGFSDSGMEFHADLVLPYKDEFQSIAMHGQFILVQLEHEDEAVFGRITNISSQGRLVSPIGEDYANRAVRDQRPIPEELREQYLKYKVDIRILGVLRREGDKLLFVPSHRRLPHVGAQVAFLSPDLLQEVSNANDNAEDAVPIGFLAFGEFVYCGDDERAHPEPWMVVKSPAVMPKFQISKLLARRSFVFARAGFGKSNLVKLLFSSLYAGDPAVPRRGGTKAPVGTVIFDPDGEYFWPDHQGRPGLCDVEHLADRLVVFTDRHAPSPAYQSFVVDGVKLDIRQLPAARVLGIALSRERQDHQNVAKLKGLSPAKWRELVDDIDRHRINADPAKVGRLLGLPADDVQVTAAIANMTRVVSALHDKSSQLLTALKRALSEGKLCIVDVSRMRGQEGLQLAGVILADIFEHNQNEFTAANPKTIPTIAVIEEAQSMLSAARSSDEGPFVAWVKEGRKYDLGAMMITQQPGSIPDELLSQGDNFFVFHLLSAADLMALKRANAHFSDDLLSALLNEPLVGHGIFWSSAPGTDSHARPYPLSVRALSFNDSHKPREPSSTAGPLDIYAARLRRRFQDAVNAATLRADTASGTPVPVSPEESETVPPDEPVDVDTSYRANAISALGQSREFWDKLSRPEGIKWGRVQGLLAAHGPGEDIVGNQFDWAYQSVVPALNDLVGVQDTAWRTERRPDERGRPTTWIIATRPPARPASQPGGQPDEDDSGDIPPPF